MGIGTKAQGQDCWAKLVTIRHGHAPRRSCNAQEKAIETSPRKEPSDRSLARLRYLSV